MNDLNSDINLKNLKQELVIIKINLTGNSTLILIDNRFCARNLWNSTRKNSNPSQIMKRWTEKKQSTDLNIPEL